jgi:hypothetical protein
VTSPSGRGEVDNIDSPDGRMPANRLLMLLFSQKIKIHHPNILKTSQYARHQPISEYHKPRPISSSMFSGFRLAMLAFQN